MGIVLENWSWSWAWTISIVWVWPTTFRLSPLIKHFFNVGSPPKRLIGCIIAKSFHDHFQVKQRNWDSAWGGPQLQVIMSMKTESWIPSLSHVSGLYTEAGQSYDNHRLECLISHLSHHFPTSRAFTSSHRWIILQPMPVLPVHVQHKFNSNANTYLNGSNSICSARFFFIFDEPSMLHGDNFSCRCILK